MNEGVREGFDDESAEGHGKLVFVNYRNSDKCRGASDWSEVSAKIGPEDDSPPKIQFSLATGNSGDGIEAATSTLTIELDAVSSKSTTVTYNTSDNDAIAGTDYTALTNQTATVAAGSTADPVTTADGVASLSAVPEVSYLLRITLAA